MTLFALMIILLMSLNIDSSWATDLQDPNHGFNDSSNFNSNINKPFA